MQRLKNRLYRLLGQERYLQLVGAGYFAAYRTGLLRRNPDYAWHYFARKLIRRGDHVMDIGANLGYFSVLFADWVGPEGRVWAVEPVPVYRRLLTRHLGDREQAVIIPYALGAERGTVSMGIPGPQPFRHGLTQVLEADAEVQAAHVVEVKMRPPEEAFPDLPQLDYVKCDVEGFELQILPLLEPYLRRWEPLVQVEIGSGNRRALFDYFERLGYRGACLREWALWELGGAGAPCAGDVLFYPRAREERLISFLRRANRQKPAY